MIKNLTGFPVAKSFVHTVDPVLRFLRTSRALVMSTVETFCRAVSLINN